MQCQPNQPPQPQQQQQQQSFISDEEWKVNAQKTTEYRKKVFQLILSKIQNPNTQQFLDYEGRCFNESKTRQEYTSKIQSYYHSVQQQQHQHQQQQQQQQQQLVSNNPDMMQQQQQPQMQHINLQQQQQLRPQLQQTVVTQQAIQSQAQKPQIIVSNAQTNLSTGSKNIINLNNITAQQQLQQQQQQQQQQIKLQQTQQQQIIRPNLVPQQQQAQFIQTVQPGSSYIHPQQHQPVQSTTPVSQQQQPTQNIIITNLNQPTQQQTPQVLNQPIQRPQIVNIQQQQQQPPINQQYTAQSMPTTGSNEEEELYNKKKEELKQNHLSRLEKMLANSVNRNPNETAKIKAFIDVLMGVKKVSYDTLLKCEASLNQQQQPPQPKKIIQQQPQIPPQAQPVQTQQPPPVQPQQIQHLQQHLISKVPSQVIPNVGSPYQQAAPPGQIKIIQPTSGPQPQQISPNLQQIKPPVDTQPVPIQQPKSIGQATTPVIIPQPQQPPPQQRLNIFQQLSQSIEACNNSNPVHKNNVRYLLENIKNTIEGPPVKLLKVDKEDLKEDIKRKPLINLRDSLINKNNINIQNEHMPKKLVIELASLSSSKFRIEAKSKYETLVLPIDGKLNSEKISEDENKSVNGGISSPLENYYVTLKCTIVNRNLALVPPIRIFIPYDYPESNPFVDVVQLDEFDDDMLPEYNTLGILRRINKQFQINYLRLSERYSVTQLLDAWYSSVETL